MSTERLKIAIQKSQVKSISVVDTDFVLNLVNGKKLVIPRGALRAMLNPEFSISFEGGEVLSGQEVLQSAGPLKIVPSDMSSVVSESDAVLVAGSNPEQVLHTGGAVRDESAPAPAASSTDSKTAAAKSTDKLSLDDGASVAQTDATAKADTDSSLFGISPTWGLAGAAGAAGIAGLAGAGGGAAAAAAPVVTTPVTAAVSPSIYTVTGVISLGPLTEGGALVQIFSADGALLGSQQISGDSSGLSSYTIFVTNGYTGAILVVVSKGSYISDITGQPVSLPGSGYKSVVVADGKPLVANITDTTNLVANSLGVKDNKISATKEEVSATLVKFSTALGIDVQSEKPSASVDIKGATVNADKISKYGAWDTVVSFLAENDALPSISLSMSSADISSALKSAMAALAEKSPDKFTSNVINALLSVYSSIEDIGFNQWSNANNYN
jgi:hypothetical protein